jgi:hypothetical protein
MDVPNAGLWKERIAGVHAQNDSFRYLSRNETWLKSTPEDIHVCAAVYIANNNRYPAGGKASVSHLFSAEMFGFTQSTMDTEFSWSYFHSVFNLPPMS